MTIELPCTARLLALRPDGTGVLEAESGAQFKCGATSFARRRQETSWFPTVGERYLVLEAREFPIIGLRATHVVELNSALPTATADPDAMPRSTLAEAFAALRARGEALERAPCGASRAQIVALERRVGHALPASYASFLETHHWFTTRSLRVFAVEDQRERPGVESNRDAVRRFVQATLASSSWAPDVHARGAALCAWIPVLDLGDTLPLGTGVFIDDDGDFRAASVREFPSVPVGPKRREAFERVVVELLAESFDDG